MCTCIKVALGKPEKCPLNIFRFIHDIHNLVFHSYLSVYGKLHCVHVSMPKCVYTLYDDNEIPCVVSG